MNGARVGITATRRAQEQAVLVRALGGEPVVGSCLGLDRAAALQALAPALERVTTAPPDIAVFLTGIGARHLVAVARAGGHGPALERALAGAEVVARGPKARRTLAGLGIEPAWTAEPAEARAIAARLLQRDLRGVRILVQCTGPEAEPLVETLAAAGADVTAAHPYRFGDAPDAAAARALAGAAVAGTVDAVTFTSALAAEAFADLVDDAGGRPAERVLLVAVGPVTGAALRARGWRVDVEPAVPRMGAMYQALASRLTGPAASAP